MAQKARDRLTYAGTFTCAAAGLVFGNLVLGQSSAALAQALSARFGSTWFFDDLLASSISPLGALLGLVFGFVLFDLPRLSLHQAYKDNLSECAQYLRGDVLLQESLFRVLGALIGRGPVNLLQRELLLKICMRLELIPLSDSKLSSQAGSKLTAEEERALQWKLNAAGQWLKAGAQGAESELKAALLYLNQTCRERRLYSLRPWICARLADLALTSLQLNQLVEEAYYELTAGLGAYRADSESQLHLKLESRAERSFSRREALLMACPWNFSFLDEQQGQEGQDGYNDRQSDGQWQAGGGFADGYGSYSWQQGKGAGADAGAGWSDSSGGSGSSARSSLNEMSVSEACQILGVSALAPLTEIKARYRKLMFKYHPDHQAGKSARAREQAKEQALLVKLAYELLLSLRS